MDDKLLANTDRSSESFSGNPAKIVPVSQTQPPDMMNEWLGRWTSSSDCADDVTPEELEDARRAAEDYFSGRDPGYTAEQAKAELLGPSD